MQNLFLVHPEITQIKANIISRRIQGENTQLMLDRTIFLPKSDMTVNEGGNISGLELISVEEKKDNIIHLVKGKPSKSEVILNLNYNDRLRNLSYNSAFVLFNIVMESFYNFKDIKLSLTDELASMVIEDFFDVFDPRLIENQMNFIIQKSLPITSQKGITNIYPIGDSINNGICFDNTSKIRAFKILYQEYQSNNLYIEFFAGSDILNL